MKSQLLYLLLFAAFSNCTGQQPFGADQLKLEKEIALPNVKGRIDHMAVDLKAKVLYMAALGNNTVEVIDLNKGAVIKSIAGIEEPQGIAYIPEQNAIAVASGRNGDCLFFNASTFKNIATVHLGGDADNIRYDAAERKMYVGYGSGGMAMIDPVAHKQTGNVKLPAHPESFQLDKKNNKLYVNLADAHSIAVIDLKSFTVADMWKISKYRANYPMTLDTANNLVIVGFRHPAVLVAYNAVKGSQISSNDLVDDVDDIFYYSQKEEILASGGGGSINLFRKDGSKYKLIGNVPSRDGARTSLLIPQLKLFAVAARAAEGKNAALLLYHLE